MRSDPEPINPRRLFNAQSSVTDADANGPQVPFGSDFLEVKRRMLWIGLKEAVILVREQLNRARKIAVMFPKSWESEMFHKGFPVSEAISESTSARTESKRPESRSSAIC